MAQIIRSVMQFRYDGNDSNFNYPNTITRDVLTTSNIFANKNIIQLGIQATPGTRFKLNHAEGTINSGGWIVIGTSGIYELNVEDFGLYITSIQFEDSSLKKVMIDIIYETTA